MLSFYRDSKQVYVLPKVPSACNLGHHLSVTPGRCDLKRGHSLVILLMYVAARVVGYDLSDCSVAHNSGYV